MFKKNKFKILFCNIVLSSIFFAAIPMEDGDSVDEIIAIPAEGTGEYNVLYPAHPFCCPDGRVPEKFLRKISHMPPPGFVPKSYNVKLEEYETFFDNIFIQFGCNKKNFLHDINILSEVFRSLQHFPYHISKCTHPNINSEDLPKEINNLFMQLAQYYSRLCGFYETLKHLSLRQDSCIRFKISTINQIQMVYRDINDAYVRLNEIPIQSLNNTKLLNCIIDQHYGHLRSNLGEPLSALIIGMLNGSDKIYKKYELLFNDIITNSSHIKCLCGNACDRPISVRYSELNFPVERDVLPVEIFEKQKEEQKIKRNTTTTQPSNAIPEVEFKKPKANTNPKSAKRKKKKKSKTSDTTVSSNSTITTTTTTISVTGPEEAAIEIEEKTTHSIELEQPTEDLAKQEQGQGQSQAEASKKTKKTQARKKKKQERKIKEQQEINKKAQEEALLQAMQKQNEAKVSKRKKKEDKRRQEKHNVLKTELVNGIGVSLSEMRAAERGNTDACHLTNSGFALQAAQCHEYFDLFKKAKSNFIRFERAKFGKYIRVKKNITVCLDFIADRYNEKERLFLSMVDMSENTGRDSDPVAALDRLQTDILNKIYELGFINATEIEHIHPDLENNIYNKGVTFIKTILMSDAESFPQELLVEYCSQGSELPSAQDGSNIPDMSQAETPNFLADWGNLFSQGVSGIPGIPNMPNFNISDSSEAVKGLQRMLQETLNKLENK